ncbi:chorismate-binding protein [Flavivirga spongiicola]|uniref:Chorismate-binding protein n=1 Tax=Flavivirga spongiicola TaxID=421621 RepID=A0ABU7XYI6_9FLAO|nr:chorismate-binding protein [Flavivirga sp. MEBiC05379]MDO5980843.1 chorismate-binding protein [Flavivirga sp. MEBiC05379]
MTLEPFFKRIEAQYNNKLPFVAYRKPKENRVNALLQQTNDLHFTSDFTEKGFVFSPFDDTEKTVLIPLDNSEYLRADALVSEFHAEPVKKKKVNSTEDLKARQQHINLIKKGVEAISNHYFKKVVLSRQEAITVSESNPISIFKNLLNAYTSAFVYCWYHPNVGLWLGATPETLIKIEGSQFSIMALAGTQDYKGTLDVVWQNKEEQEQQFVTDFIIDHLRSSVESLKVSDVETVKAGNLLHLKTMISARLKSESNLKKIISLLHPTPAVCGLPKPDAKQFILDNEHYNRAFYTGFLGELNMETKLQSRSAKRNIENRAYTINKKSTQLYVNLRCMQLKNNNAIIYVGGGITKYSDPEKEWEETVSKSLVIKNIL